MKEYFRSLNNASLILMHVAKKRNSRGERKVEERETRERKGDGGRGREREYYCISSPQYLFQPIFTAPGVFTGSHI